MINIEEREGAKLSRLENIFSKIIEENFLNPKKEMAINVQEAYRIPNRDHRFWGKEDTTSVPTLGVIGFIRTQAHRNSTRLVAQVLSSLSGPVPWADLGHNSAVSPTTPKRGSTPRHLYMLRIPEAWLHQDLSVPEAAWVPGAQTLPGSQDHRSTPDFSPETMKAWRSWAYVIQTLREHKCQPWLLYPPKLWITIDGENKILHDKPMIFHGKPNLHSIVPQI